MSEHWIHCDMEIGLSQDALDEGFVYKSKPSELFASLSAKVTSSFFMEGEDVCCATRANDRRWFYGAYMAIFRTLGACSGCGTKVSLTGGVKVRVEETGEVIYTMAFEEKNSPTRLGMNTGVKITDYSYEAMVNYRERLG